MVKRDFLDIMRPIVVRTEVKLPASKSLSNRALLIRALTADCPMPENLSDCDDTDVMLRALSEMPEVIDIGAAGTAMRFLTAYLCVTPGTHLLTGTERMRHRPIAVLVDALRAIGAQVEYQGEPGFPPLRISGRAALEGGELKVRGDISSQYISALLMIAPTLKKGLRLTLTDRIASRPYIDMTITMMREFGAEVEWESDDTIVVRPTGYRSTAYKIENDWSAASYWYEIVALSNAPGAWVELPGLRLDSTQGDNVVRHIFERLGVGTEICTCESSETGIRLKKTGQVECFLQCDMSSCPDLAQTIVVTCALLDVPFCLTGLESLRIKETDRTQALKNELAKLGYDIDDSREGTLEWNGERKPESEEDALVSILTYDDHRMAMAFAPVCCRRNMVRIMEPSVVTKSYPTFWDDIRQAGFHLP